ncbi:hypothetical protein DFJ58DRAFT_726050 [Suillus subalutaceus]|uniref:uncharacterized protein n=1 Tax=Suillus subalutaceus TaxID=48586 RepID=UPI001B8610EB|nr:uncharacterized protein DFJ58DRAFT_726050 [Suillus subalutaceus]KAG1860261.1 hypothetical protein DFJ58DRAFT_726050 [Suillus subalutaceus]
MSQPKTVAQRMATWPKNATQHPGRIVIETRKEAKEASHKAVQESYQRIATMQAQMQADQENARVDAPKPKPPRARPVGKAAKTSKTPDSTMDGKGQKGRARQLAAGVNVEHPATDEDLEEEPVVAAKPQRKKATKPLVRDAIEALNAGVVIDGSTKARDANVKTIDITSSASLSSQRGSTISSNVPPRPHPSDEYDSEELFTKPLSGFKGKKALTIASKALDDRAEVLSDIRDQIIFMNSGIGDIPPPPQLASLGDYKSDSDASHELQAADYDSDLTNIATTLKAPPAKRLKSESSTTTITGSHRAIATAIATPSKAIARSAFRKKHLPKGCQMANKWAREFIPTAIRCVGDLSEVWTLSDDILCPILQSAWDAVYKDKIPHTVTADGPVIALTLQRLSEWRNSISNVALVVLANFMISQEDLNTDQDQDGEMSRPFQSDLLVQVLVQHKCATSGAVNMPGTNNTLPGHSKGALALMERAIKLFANGQMLLSDIATAGNGRNNKTPLHINPSTGKESSVPLARLPDSVIYRNSELAQSLAMKRRWHTDGGG